MCLVLQGLRAQDTLHIAILGDSNTWLGGDNCDNPKGWNKWFADRMQPATCKSYARSGATWTNTVNTKRNITENIGQIGDDNVIYNQVCRLKDAYDKGETVRPDVILIAAGTNDVWFINKRPMALDMSADDAFLQSGKDIRTSMVSTILTLAKSVRYNCELLTYYFPDAIRTDT